MKIRHRLHRSWDSLIPAITKSFQPLPLRKSGLHSNLLIVWRSLLEAWDRCPEIRNLSNNVEHAVDPDLLSSGFSLPSEVHVYTPLIWLPCNLPIKVQAAQ